jgi:hypothetical protein
MHTISETMFHGRFGRVGAVSGKIGIQLLQIVPSYSHARNKNISILLFQDVDGN